MNGYTTEENDMAPRNNTNIIRHMKIIKAKTEESTAYP